MVIFYGPKTRPKMCHGDGELGHMIDERNSQDGTEEVKHEYDEPRGERDDANLWPSSPADHAQEVV